MFTGFLIPLFVVNSFIGVDTINNQIPLSVNDNKTVEFMMDKFKEQARPVTGCESVDVFNNAQYFMTAFDCPIGDNFVVVDKANKKRWRVWYRQYEEFYK